MNLDAYLDGMHDSGGPPPPMPGDRGIQPRPPAETWQPVAGPESGIPPGPRTSLLVREPTAYVVAGIGDAGIAALTATASVAGPKCTFVSLTHREEGPSLPGTHIRLKGDRMLTLPADRDQLRRCWAEIAGDIARTASYLGRTMRRSLILCDRGSRAGGALMCESLSKGGAYVTTVVMPPSDGTDRVGFPKHLSKLVRKGHLTLSPAPGWFALRDEDPGKAARTWDKYLKGLIRTIEGLADPDHDTHGPAGAISHLRDQVIAEVMSANREFRQRHRLGDLFDIHLPH